MKQLNDKRAIVTGAASGIGRAIASALAAEGVHLCLLDINVDGLHDVQTALLTTGIDVQTFVCDLADAKALSDTVARIREECAPVDILINNAGVAYYGPTEAMTVEQWDWVMSVNLMAPIRLTQALLPDLLERPEAHIVNLSSIAGLVAGGRLTGYHASKFGLVGFSESLRAEYARSFLGVTTLCPGLVQSRFFDSAVSGRSNKEVPQPPKWGCISTEKVARRTIRAIRKNHGLVPVGAMAHLLWRFKRFLPGVIDFSFHIGRKKPRKPASGVAHQDVSPQEAEEKRAA